jgi:hypothetical protein
MFQKITIDKTTGNNNISALLNTLNEMEKGIKNKTDDTSKNLRIEIDIMRLALIQINKDINTSATPELTPTEKKQMLGNYLVTIRTTYMAEVYKAQKGFHVAGATFALYITGVFAGINIQHVRQHANIVQDPQADRIEAKILRREPVAATTDGLAPYGGALTNDKKGIVMTFALGK